MLGPGPHALAMWEPGNPMEDGVEYWALVDGYGGNYLVSTEGRVMRIAGGQGTRPGTVEHGYILTATPNSRGYPTVKLSIKGERYTEKNHLLVQRTFAAIPRDHQVHHDDGDQTNSAAPNLKSLDSKAHAEADRARRQQKEVAPA